MRYFAQVVNRGPAVRDAVVDIELPPHSRLSDNPSVGRVDGHWWAPGSQPGPEKLRCSRGTARITCSVGPLPQDANINIVVCVTINRSAPTGVTRQLRMTLRPGSGQGFSATAIRVPVRLARPIRLEVSLQPSRPVVLLGVRATVRVRIHNPGPDVARDTVLFAEDNFKRNSHSVSPRLRYPDEPERPPADPSFYFLVPSAGYLNFVRSPDPNDGGRVDEDTRTLTFWRVPAIAAGATATMPIEVEATSVGKTEFHVGALSSAGDPACLERGRRPPQCGGFAVSVPALVVDRGSATSRADLRALVLFGALVVVFGAITYFSSRRRHGAGDRQTRGSTR